jgi:hypothetical protein
VALVIGRLAFAGGREGLAGTGTGPNRSVVGDSCESESEGPSADAGEEMALRVTLEVIGTNVHDRARVQVAWRDVSNSNEIAKPGRAIGIDLVVIGRHS